ncbi:hypothetical protein KIPB_008093, partial [Kipferlia bialata]|eukprot:g8093.t1
MSEQGKEGKAAAATPSTPRGPASRRPASARKDLSLKGPATRPGSASRWTASARERPGHTPGRKPYIPPSPGNFSLPSSLASESLLEECEYLEMSDEGEDMEGDSLFDFEAYFDSLTPESLMQLQGLFVREKHRPQASALSQFTHSMATARGLARQGISRGRGLGERDREREREQEREAERERARAPQEMQSTLGLDDFRDAMEDFLGMPSVAATRLYMDLDSGEGVSWLSFLDTVTSSGADDQQETEGIRHQLYPMYKSGDVLLDAKNFPPDPCLSHLRVQGVFEHRKNVSMLRLVPDLDIYVSSGWDGMLHIWARGLREHKGQRKSLPYTLLRSFSDPFADSTLLAEACVLPSAVQRDLADNPHLAVGKTQLQRRVSAILGVDGGLPSEKPLPPKIVRRCVQPRPEGVSVATDSVEL